jgi:hypothetical protein
MSNPQHPQFANATAIDTGVLHVADPGSADGDARRATRRCTGEQASAVGVGVTGLGLWVFLITELARNYSLPTAF